MSTPKYRIAPGANGWKVEEWDGKRWTWINSFNAEQAAVGFVKSTAQMRMAAQNLATYYDMEGNPTDARR